MLRSPIPRSDLERPKAVQRVVAGAGRGAGRDGGRAGLAGLVERRQAEQFAVIGASEEGIEGCIEPDAELGRGGGAVGRVGSEPFEGVVVEPPLDDEPLDLSLAIAGREAFADAEKTSSRSLRFPTSPRTLSRSA